MTAHNSFWSECVSLGIPDMDRQHEGFFDLINQVSRGLLTRQPLSAIEGVIADLEAYARAHFGAEEALMELHAYPGLSEHLESHAQFVTKVEQLAEKVAAGESVGLEMLRFLSDWWSFHIGMADRQYADFIREGQGLVVSHAESK